MGITLEEMAAQARRFLKHIDMDSVKVSTFEGGLEGGIELNAGVSEVRGGIEQVLLVSCHPGGGFFIENEGGNAEPVQTTFLGALTTALEILYSWRLYDAMQVFKERNGIKA